MEFNEKLQELRKQRGYTQEELAEALYVSRTAISKWESGRGYPNIDSLKALAEFFSISIDELLSGEELIAIAQTDSQKEVSHTRDVIFGLLDCSTAALFFLPLFREKTGDVFREISLLSLNNIASYLKIVYYGLVIAMVSHGVLTLAMQNIQCAFWITYKNKISIILNLLGVVLFVISLQPYAAVLLLIYMIIKMAIFKKGS